MQQNTQNMKDDFRYRFVAACQIVFLMLAVWIAVGTLFAPQSDTVCEILSASPLYHTIRMNKTGVLGVSVPRDALLVDVWVSPIDDDLQAGQSVSPRTIKIYATGNDAADASALVGQRLSCSTGGAFGTVTSLNNKDFLGWHNNLIVVLFTIYVIVGMLLWLMGISFLRGICSGAPLATFYPMFMPMSFPLAILYVVAMTSIIGWDKSCRVIAARTGIASPHAISIWATSMHDNDGVRFDLFIDVTQDPAPLLESLRAPGATVPCRTSGWGIIPVRLLEGIEPLSAVRSEHGMQSLNMLWSHAGLFLAALVASVIFNGSEPPRKEAQYQPAQEVAL
jgi:hypothetical protein